MPSSSTAERPDRRLGIITEQADRLSRDGPPAADREPDRVRRAPPAAGGLRARAAGPRAWEALGAADVPFTLEDESAGLARARRRRPARPGPVGAPRQRREVRRPDAGRGRRSRIDARHRRLAITIADHGPGVSEADRDRLFGRFERGAERPVGRGQRPRPVRVARAVPGDGRRPRARARATTVPARRSPSRSRRRPQTRRSGPGGSPQVPGGTTAGTRVRAQLVALRHRCKVVARSLRHRPPCQLPYRLAGGNVDVVLVARMGPCLRAPNWPTGRLCITT